MGVSRQTTFTLACMTVLSVVVPGSAGYLSARLDAVDRAHQRLASLEERLREEQLARQDRTVAALAASRLCEAERSERREPGRKTPRTVTVPAPADAFEKAARAAERERRRKARERREIAAVSETVQGTVVRKSPEVVDPLDGPPAKPLAEPPDRIWSSGRPLG
ncbi:hypothetical protein ACFFMN_31970 [Planobispora siamensis]|uniref:Uncharacterized protein n=1 Tax=Planobispora siamensis TaxID=936338 RepID=A0A8J3SF90_9ACTN|nr:hypothetical protein [Planobispora siamensis]GIH90909.1 hypothetical protein Psi01_15390 [Planobispora siamensis]